MLDSQRSRIARIVAEAAGLRDDSARFEFLARACGDDQALFQETRQALTNFLADEHFLTPGEARSFDYGEACGSTQAASETDARIGQRVGRYEILRRL